MEMWKKGMTEWVSSLIILAALCGQWWRVWLCDALGYIHNALQLQTSHDATRLYAFHCASIEVCKSRWGHAKFLHSS